MQQAPISTRPEAALPQRPRLLLGPIGFAADRQQRLAVFVRECAPGAVDWQLCHYGDADAWWVNAMHAHLQPDGTVRVPPAVPQGRAVRLRMAQMDRPVAFAEPIAPGLPEPPNRFDMRDRQSIAHVLARFESSLRLLAVQLALAAKMIAHENEVHAGASHLIGGGRLLAVADPRGEVGTAPGATAAELADAAWARPAADRHVPPTFERISISMLMWQFAIRSDSDLLPARYRSRAIYLRRAPRVPQHMQGDGHLMILRELVRGPADFEELERRTGLADRRLARDLAALYFTGAITTDPARAATSRPALSGTASFDSSMGASDAGLPSRDHGDSGFSERVHSTLAGPSIARVQG